MTNKKKILIIGGNSFTAESIIKYIKNDFEIILTSKKNSRKIFDCTNYKVNLIEKDPFKKLNGIKDSIETIIWLAQDKKNQVNKVNVPEVNIYGLLQALKFYSKSSSKNFIFFSSGSVYGSKSKRANEKDNPSPDNYYGYTKLIGEKLCYYFSQKYNKSFVILRPFYIYGKNQKSKLFFEIKDKIIKNNKIKLAQGIGMKFNACYVEDVALVVKSFLKTKNDSFSIYNLANKEILYLNNVVNLIAQKLNRKYHLDTHSAEININICDNKKIKRKFNINFKNFSEAISLILDKY